MVKKKKITNADLDKVLRAFGYEVRKSRAHLIYQHPNGRQTVVLPMARPTDLAYPTHVTIVETALSDDGIASREDFWFYLENGKLPSELISKGDRLIWTIPRTGVKVEVIAAAGEKDGMVVIKQRGTFSPCPVEQLKKVQ
jgi:predicted RNA binding protein YcfA (HicA-like mRNA interferase family)